MEDELNRPRNAISLKNILYLFSKQFEKGDIVRFTGGGSKTATRAKWEEFSQRLSIACVDNMELLMAVDHVLTRPIEDPLPDVPEDSPVRRVLYATLMTITGKPTAHVLHQSEYSTPMDGLGALKALRVKYEPIQKSAFRKSLIFDVVFFQITGNSNPESSLMAWVKAIDHLKNAGCTTLDDLLKDILVNALPTEYSYLVTSWDEGGGRDRIDQADMIKSIVTHYEHVIAPSNPRERERQNSAYARYKTHTGYGENGNTRGNPNRGNKDADRRKGNPNGSKGGTKPRDNAARPPNGQKKPSNGLKGAQRRQKDEEAKKKAENRVCSACGAKGHSPSSPRCPKRANATSRKNATRQESSMARGNSAAHSSCDDDLDLNEDGFLYIMPRSDSGAEEK